MTTNTTATNQSYRPAVRGLVFGLLAIGVRIGTMALVALSVPGHPAEVMPFAMPLPLMALLNLVGTIVGLVGVGYSAIAAHRREWGVALVLAWLLNVVAVLCPVELFVYAGL